MLKISSSHLLETVLVSYWFRGADIVLRTQVPVLEGLEYAPRLSLDRILKWVVSLKNKDTLPQQQSNCQTWEKKDTDKQIYRRQITILRRKKVLWVASCYYYHIMANSTKYIPRIYFYILTVRNWHKTYFSIMIGSQWIFSKNRNPLHLCFISLQVMQWMHWLIKTVFAIVFLAS